MTAEPVGADAVVRSLTHDARGRVAAVTLQAPAACPRCAEGRGCGANPFGRRRKSGLVTVRLPADCAARPGDPVRLCLAEGQLLRAALLVYGLPLAGSVLAAVAAWSAGAGEGASVLAVLAGLAVGACLARRPLRQAERSTAGSLRVIS